jgi:hypothetical protein
MLQNKSGAHLARSMMFTELEGVLRQTSAESQLSQIQALIVEENILGKPTESSRKKTFRHLRDLYGLSPDIFLLQTLRRLALECPQDLPLLAMICCFCRDAQLRESFQLIGQTKEGEVVSRLAMEEHLEECFPGRFGSGMKGSLARNVNTTWTVSGHLSGRAKKIRTIPRGSWGASTYAMLVGWLFGLRGQILLDSVFGQLVAASPEQITRHLQTAASRDWLRLLHGGGVVEIDFTKLIQTSTPYSDVPH